MQKAPTAIVELNSHSSSEQDSMLSIVARAQSIDLTSLALDEIFDFYFQNIEKLLSQPIEAFVCGRMGHLIGLSGNDLVVMGATHQFKKAIHQTVCESEAVSYQTQIQRQFDLKRHLYFNSYSLIHICYAGLELNLTLTHNKPLTGIQRQMLELLVGQLATKFHSFNLLSKLKTVSLNDRLTGLHNRTSFINSISRHKALLGKARVIALIDINHFSDINDGLGIDTGNALLSSVAQRLSDAFQGESEIGRISGDVFGLIGQIEQLTPESIHKVFESVFSIGVHRIPLNVSIGFYRLNKELEPSQQIRRATIALNTAKMSITKNYAFYSRSIDDSMTAKSELSRLLQFDFEAKRLQVWFQPQVNLEDEKIVGLEALLRWQTETGDYVSPEEFIPLAEYSGLIIKIGKWVFEQAIKAHIHLRNLGCGALRIAVNVSILQFREKGFISFIESMLEKYKVDPSLIELEITENVVMSEPHIVISALNQLKALGFKVALDDFGTGYSSLSYLQLLPLDRLKIDKSFTVDLENEKSSAILQSIFSLGQQLGLSTIAEGIETRKHAHRMLKMGAQEAQGFLYSSAIPLPELEEWLRSRREMIH